MKRHYTVILVALLVVGSLTGFVITQQVPTEWEYGVLIRQSLRRVGSDQLETILTAWITKDATLTLISDAEFQEGIGCPRGPMTPHLYNCLGSDGWELAGVTSRDMPLEDDVEYHERTVSFFKRPVR